MSLGSQSGPARSPRASASWQSALHLNTSYHVHTTDDTFGDSRSSCGTVLGLVQGAEGTARKSRKQTDTHLRELMSTWTAQRVPSVPAWRSWRCSTGREAACMRTAWRKSPPNRTSLLPDEALQPSCASAPLASVDLNSMCVSRDAKYIIDSR